MPNYVPIMGPARSPGACGWGEPPGPGSAALVESAGNGVGTGSGRFEKGSGREAGHQLGGGRRQGPGVAGRRQAGQPAREPGKALNAFGARS